jgi:two-component system, OmpR family, phosphate regulon sensor histidine kinase PhoR
MRWRRAPLVAEPTGDPPVTDSAGDRARGLIRDLDRRMRQHLDPEAVAEEVVAGLGPLSRADRVHVRFVESRRTGPVVAQWSTRELARLPITAPGAQDLLESASAVSTRGAQALVVEDVRLALAAGSLPADQPTLHGVGALAVVPVLAGAEQVGVLVVARADGRPPFDAADVAVMDLVATDFGRAVQHARLFRQQSALVAQLRELDRTKSDFLSTISHELRTPLTSIVGYVEMLRDGDAGELRPMQRSMLEVVGRNAQRLQDLIEDVLMISRVESGAVRSERMPVALAGVVDQVVSALRPQAEEGGVRIDVFPVPAQAILLADPAQMDRMLLNLIGNAVKFTPERGRVGVSVQVGPDQLVLRVDDTGIGVPAAELPSLFNRFFRASNATTRQIPGTGLGLAIVAGIVAAHDGRVEVDSTQGRGTTFTVTLPRWDPDGEGRDGSA